MSTNFILIVEVIKKLIRIKWKYLPVCDLIIFQLKTPSQGKSPSRASKTKGDSQQWYCRIGTKDSMFTDREHARLIRYNGFVT